MTIIATIPKNTLDKFWKMGTIVNFRLLLPDSLKYRSKADSFLFIYLFTYSFIYLFICF